MIERAMLTFVALAVLAACGPQQALEPTNGAANGELAALMKERGLQEADVTAALMLASSSCVRPQRGPATHCRLRGIAMASSFATALLSGPLR